jgi:hypothetical protein
MLWQKSWLDTRWPFLIGFGLLALLACGSVVDYPRVARLLPTIGRVDPNAPMARFIQDAIDVERTYRGFVWHEWFRQNLPQTWTLFAVFIGSTGLVASKGALFTLSLPYRADASSACARSSPSRNSWRWRSFPRS